MVDLTWKWWNSPTGCITSIHYRHNSSRIFLPYDNKNQVKELNEKVIREIYPTILNNLKFRDHYLNEINGPRKIDQLPVSTSIRGSNTLPAIPNTF